ncbi:MAG: hypothetical protein JWQ64_3228 [Subtercola sp.]|nr:hypothetical protein [Subtercola sp.]
MQVSIDVTDALVFVVGHPVSARRILARYRAAGADAVLLTPDQARMRLNSAETVHSSDAKAGPSSVPPRLIVWVDGDELHRIDLAQQAARLSIWMTREKPAARLPRGHVSLVGGGPGDLGLMTMAGRQALADADVVLFDRLAPTELLSEFAPAAELIDVGKLPGHHAVPQRVIEDIMIEKALLGNEVVRLKGGDPFVFGRGGEEVIACRTNDVPYTVIPGVTSAVAVPAAAGIPLTHREISRAFTVVSGHAPFSDIELGHRAGLGGTLVVLMGVGTLVQLVNGLQRRGMPATMPLAIIEQGYSPQQRTTISTIGGITEKLGHLSVRSPAVIVIGEVVRVASEDPSELCEASGIIRSAAKLAT